jgi:hypothetical protein
MCIEIRKIRLPGKLLTGPEIAYERFSRYDVRQQAVFHNSSNGFLFPMGVFT